MHSNSKQVPKKSSIFSELKRKASRRKHPHQELQHHQMADQGEEGGGYEIEEDIYQPMPRKQPGKRGRKSNAEKQRQAQEEAVRGASPTDSPPKKKFMR